MAPALRWSGGAVCAVSPPSAVTSLFRRRGRHLSKRQPVTSAAQHRGMARSSLLFALIVIVAAALFAQLPLAGAAACAPLRVCIARRANRPPSDKRAAAHFGRPTTGGGGGAGTGGAGGGAECHGNCPGTNIGGGSGGAGAGGSGGGATSSGSTPSGCVLAPARHAPTSAGGSVLCSVCSVSLRLRTGQRRAAAAVPARAAPAALPTAARALTTLCRSRARTDGRTHMHAPASAHRVRRTARRHT